jgi:hypothetical protein
VKTADKEISDKTIKLTRIGTKQAGKSITERFSVFVGNKCDI